MQADNREEYLAQPRRVYQGLSSIGIHYPDGLQPMVSLLRSWGLFTVWLECPDFLKKSMFDVYPSIFEEYSRWGHQVPKHLHNVPWLTIEVEKNPPRSAHFHGTMFHNLEEICNNNWVLKGRELLTDEGPMLEQ